MKCIENEIPFDLPEGWEWTRLGFISSSIQYGLSDSAQTSGTHRLLRITDIQNGSVNWNTVPFTTVESPESYLLKKGDIVFARTGATVGKSFLLADIPYESVYASYLIRIGLFDCVLPEYIYQFFNSNQYWDQITDKSVGVGQPNCNGTSLKNLLLPLAPFSEQKRIVPVANDLIRLVSDIESERDDFLDNVATLKSKILDLAIRGQLVPQDPADEPASDLLNRIRAEKEELIKQGKVKRDKKESVIFKGEDNSYYEDIPQNWEEVSLLSIAEVELGKTLDSARNTGEPRDYLRSVNIRWNEIDLSDLKQMKIESEELERYTVHKGDLLICEGGDVGRCCIWERDTPIIYQNALHRVRFFGSCSPKFFLYYMMYLESLGYLKRVSNGVTIKHLTKNVLASIPFLLPPVAEQYRIVTAIEESFSYLDSVANTLE